MKTKEIEDLFIFQDKNKLMRLKATTEAQIKQTDCIEKNIQKKLKELYIPCKE